MLLNQFWDKTDIPVSKRKLCSRDVNVFVVL